MADLKFQNKCIILRKQGFTLNEIVNVLKRPKSSVYFHIRKVKLPKATHAKIIARNKTRIAQFAKSQKGQSKFGRGYREFNRWEGDHIYAISHLIFDGEILRGKCIYTNRSKALIDSFQEAMKSIYDFKATIRKREYDIFKVAYHNVALANYLQIKANELLEDIANQSRENKKIFLKSFFDDEGSVYYINNKRQVRGFQKAVPILLLIQSLLKEFNIRSRVDAKYKEVIIGGKENLKKFNNQINFSKGVFVNPDRSNSIWKRKIEKRQILQLALDSYK